MESSDTKQIAIADGTASYLVEGLTGGSAEGLAQGSAEYLHNIDAQDSPTLRRWRQLRCYGFAVGSYKLLLRQGQFCELLAKPNLAALPNAPPYLRGITNVRGSLVPVYDLLLALGEDSAGGHYALLVGDKERAAALSIASKPLQFDLAEMSAAATPDDLPEPLASAISECYADARGDVWLVVDHECLFLSLANS